MTDRAVVLLSGGLDSSTLLAHAMSAGVRCFPLAIDYGQRHRREINAAATVAQFCGLGLEIADLHSIRHLLGGSALTDDAVAVPHGHYAAPTMAATVVPNRNLIMLSVAAGHAAAIGAGMVFTAVHAGDHPVYADCRPDFIDAADRAIRIGTTNVGRAGAGGVRVIAPFQHSTKADIAAAAVELGVPIQHTWSCYEGGDIHCGRCATCVERLEALASVPGYRDPTAYADPDYWRTVVQTREEATA